MRYLVLVLILSGCVKGASHAPDDPNPLFKIWTKTSGIQAQLDLREGNFNGADFDVAISRFDIPLCTCVMQIKGVQNSGTIVMNCSGTDSVCAEVTGTGNYFYMPGSGLQLCTTTNPCTYYQ